MSLYLSSLDWNPFVGATRCFLSCHYLIFNLLDSLIQRGRILARTGSSKEKQCMILPTACATRCSLPYSLCLLSLLENIFPWAQSCPYHLQSILLLSKTLLVTMKVDNDSLTSLLPTPALRTELALLVALCTDEMRRNVLANFPEPEKRVSASPMASPRFALFDGDLIDFTEEEEDGKADAEHRRRQRDRDLSSPQMQGMKRAALSFFDAWRLGILKRVGEVLSVRPQAVRQRRAEYNATADVEAQKRRAQAETHPEQENGPGSGLLEIAVIPTLLLQLEQTKRNKILLCLLLLALSLENYSAQSRLLLQMVAASFHLPSSALSDLESTVSHGLLSTAANMSAEESTKKEAAENATGRRWKVGLATVAGAALIGVTGGLAAPFLAAGIGTVMGGLGLSIPLIGGYLGAMAGSSILIGGLFGSYGGRMTGMMMEKYAKEVEDFSFIPIKDIPDSTAEINSASALGEAENYKHKLRVAIGISGWLMDESDITAPWQAFSSSTIEPFALRWEVSSLLDLGISISKVLKSYAWSAAKLELVRRTIFASLFAGLWPLGLLRIARVLDNPYSVAKARSDKAGRVLAQALMQKVQGERPVTLVGYSLGARIIYQALLVLADQNAFGLVESVFLIGAPTPCEDRDWRRIRAVVAGRVVNVYSQEDYILGFLYRTSSLQYGVAGLQAVEDVERIENYDATTLMGGKGHASYRYIAGQILQQIGVEDIDLAVIEKQKIARGKLEGEPAVGQLIPTEDLLGGSELPDNRDRETREEPQHHSSIHEEITPSDNKVTNLIESPSKLARSVTPELEEEDSDEDVGQRIAMVDLDPKPVL
jgi:hypothetical protein